MILAQCRGDVDVLLQSSSLAHGKAYEVIIKSWRVSSAKMFQGVKEGSKSEQ